MPRDSWQDDQIASTYCEEYCDDAGIHKERLMRRPCVGTTCIVGIACFGIGWFLHNAMSVLLRESSVSDMRAGTFSTDDDVYETALDVDNVVEDVFDDGSQKRLTLHHKEDEWKSTISYYSDGRIRALETSAGQTREGICVYFTEDDVLKSLGIYQQGHLSAGISRQFHRQGDEASQEDRKSQVRIEHEKHLHEDRTTGVRTDFREDGKVWSVASYVDDQRHGVTRWYDKEGRLDIIEEYEHGNCVKKTGYDGDRKKYVRFFDDETGHYVRIEFGPEGQITRMQRKSKETGDYTVERYTDEGNISTRIEKLKLFPLRTTEYYERGEIKTVHDHEAGVKKYFDRYGRLTTVEYYEFNDLVRRKIMDRHGKVVEDESWTQSESDPNQWEEIGVYALPGTRLSVPEVFYGYKEYPEIRSMNDRLLAWLSTMRDWYKSAKLVSGNFESRYPSLNYGGRNWISQQFTAPSKNLAGIGILFAGAGTGPGWLRLTVHHDYEGAPTGAIVCRSWVRIPKHCPLPSLGLMVFRLPDVEWQVGAKYWFEGGVDLENSGPNMHHLNCYLVGEDRDVAFRIIENCEPVPMQRKVVVSKKARRYPWQ